MLLNAAESLVFPPQQVDLGKDVLNDVTGSGTPETGTQHDKTTPPVQAHHAMHPCTDPCKAWLARHKNAPIDPT